MPGYAGSSWYFLRFMSPHSEDRFIDKEAEEYWQNVESYNPLQGISFDLKQTNDIVSKVAKGSKGN